MPLVFTADVNQEDEGNDQVDVDADPGNIDGGYIDEDPGVMSKEDKIEDDKTLDKGSFFDDKQMQGRVDREDENNPNLNPNNMDVNFEDSNGNSSISDAQKFARRNTTEFHPDLTGK